MWGYAVENGPAHWAKMFPIAGGPHQSPIDVQANSVEVDDKLTKIVATYEPITLQDLSNTGHSWKAQVAKGISSLTGGPLKNEFVLEQFHCHWGKKDDSGSEHTINGKSYSAELHFVHWNKDEFKSFGEAASAANGLTVLGMLLKVGQENTELSKITRLLPFIRFKGQAITITEKIIPENFFPDDRSYFTYAGSLTTPPCYESVNWILFENPIEVSEEQLAAFRNLKSFHPTEKCPTDELAGCMVDNYRPPCPLNERKVRAYKDVQIEE